MATTVLRLQSTSGGRTHPETPPASWPATIRESFQNRPYDIYSAPIGERVSANRVLWNSRARFRGRARSQPVGRLHLSRFRSPGRRGWIRSLPRASSGTSFPHRALGDGVNTEANELDPTLGMGGFGLVFRLGP